MTGTALTKVNLNTSQRLGLLTLGGMAAGSTTSNLTNPVLRGIFILNKLMCKNIELPTGFTPMPPDPYSGKTARERLSKHSASALCASCHQFIDPLGLPFENYDAGRALPRQRAVDGPDDQHHLRHADRRQRRGARRQRDGDRTRSSW